MDKEKNTNSPLTVYLINNGQVFSSFTTDVEEKIVKELAGNIAKEMNIDIHIE